MVLQSLCQSLVSGSSCALGSRRPARPWTAVAGDGLVSNLVSHFFELEHRFLTSHIDREVFIDEMIEADAEKAEFCSPLLVNAICALSSV